MRLDLFKIVMVGAALFAFAFATAPWFAFRALKAATESEDLAAVGELVDFPAVRKSLTVQLAPERAAAQPEAPSIWSDPLGAMRRALEPLGPPEPKVDGYLTARGLSALTRGYQPGKAPPLPPPAIGAAERARRALQGPHPTFDYWDVDRARIAVKRPEGSQVRTLFTFERKALFTWKLVHVQLPKGER